MRTSPRSACRIRSGWPPRVRTKCAIRATARESAHRWPCTTARQMSSGTDFPRRPRLRGCRCRLRGCRCRLRGCRCRRRAAVTSSGGSMAGTAGAVVLSKTAGAVTTSPLPVCVWAASDWSTLARFGFVADDLLRRRPGWFGLDRGSQVRSPLDRHRLWCRLVDRRWFGIWARGIGHLIDQQVDTTSGSTGAGGSPEHWILDGWIRCGLLAGCRRCSRGHKSGPDDHGDDSGRSNPTSTGASHDTPRSQVRPAWTRGRNDPLISQEGRRLARLATSSETSCASTIRR